MFRVENNVPEVYVHKSRDFQLLSRLYDLAFQDVKKSILSLERLTDTNSCNTLVLPLLGTKVGFFTNSTTPDEMYRKVLSAFPLIIRHKGSAKGLQLVVNLFERLINTPVTLILEENKAIITFRAYSPPVQLFEDLLEYIRPTGYEIEWKVDVDVPAKDVDYVYTDIVSDEDFTCGRYASVVASVEGVNDTASTIGSTIVQIIDANHINKDCDVCETCND